MGIGFLYLLIIYLVLILFFIVLLIISIKNKSIKSIIFSSVFLLFLISFGFSNEIEEFKFSKENVRNDLKNLNINFKDNFKIIDNKISGMPERYQDTKLLISTAERKRIIKEIINSKNFKNLKTDDDIRNEFENKERFEKEVILNYKYPDFYSKEIFKKIDNYPTRILIYLNLNNDTLNYHKIEE